jgi:hypothetical protein
MERVTAVNCDGLLSDKDADPATARWNKKLCDFFAKWRRQLKLNADTALWDGIARDAEKYGVAHATCFYMIISSAAHKLHEVYVCEPALNYCWSPKQMREHVEEMTKLAQSAQSLAAYYRENDRATKRLGFPDNPQLREKAELFKKEAEVFRKEIANRKSITQMATRYLGRYQKDGGKRATFTREQLSFMRELSRCMRRRFGKPYNRAVAEITNIAFPQDPVDEHDVHGACRGQPTIKYSEENVAAEILAWERGQYW